MTRKSIFLLAILSFAAGAAPAAPASDSGDTRLRDTLRSTIQALNTAESDRAALQSAQADDQKRISELNGQVQALIKRSVADKAASDQAASALSARLADREKEIADLRQSLAKIQAVSRSEAAALDEGGRRRARLAADNLALQRRLADAKAKNAALFKTAGEILTRYERYGLGTALSAKEPFIGLTRVKLENQVQDYEDKLLDQKSNPVILRRALLLLLGLAVLLPTRGGDILRRGVGGSLPAGSSGGSAATPPSTVPTAATAGDMLARTTMALQAVQAMQAAARSLAAAGPNNLGLDPNHPGSVLPNVPDGLGAGGLQSASTLWQGAGAPAQTVSGGQTTVTITQSSQQALLTWQTFNVGKATTLLFDQSAGGANESEWIAFNQVTDPSGVPSQILGSIQAGGQVYVINPNGIIFGGSSQVNVHTLVASSLPINSNLVASGLLNDPDDQFLFTSVAQAAGPNGTPAFSPAPASTPEGADGAVTVQAGAALVSPTSAASVGGRIALIGPAVTNAGTISTPDGQTILAAGQQVGMAAHDSSDPSLRGLDVFVGAGAGTATNAAGGDIEAPRGDITIAAAAVNQLGMADSSTSVSFNGRIDLLAGYNSVSGGGISGLPAFFPQASGVVTLGPGSVTQVLPELASSDTIVGAALALPSQVNLQGLAVHLAANAILLAPDANVALSAGNWSYTGSGASAQDQFVYTGGQIYLEAGSAIDVSGSAGVPAPISQNFVAVQLLGTELADSPLQRNGPLFGQTVTVDVRQTGVYNGVAWVGTPLADTSGYVGLIQRTVGELTTAGGNVGLHAGGSVVIQSGASVNVSGGWIDYQGGTAATSQVVTASGQVLNIAQATPDQAYTGIYTGTSSTVNAKWGTTATSTNPQLDEGYQAGYVQGGSGGSLAITAPSVALDGSFLGATVAGPYQRTNQPAPGSFALAILGQDPALAINNFPYYSPTPPSVVFAPASALAPAAAFALDSSGSPLPLSAARQSQVVLTPALFTTGGFGSVSVNDSDGSITVPAGVALTAAAGGTIALTGANLDIEGSLAAPGGSLKLEAFDISPYLNRALTGGQSPVTPPADPNRGAFILGAQASLSVAGLMVDDGPNAAAPETLPLETNGGSISIKSFNASLAAGAVINVDGGAAIGAADKITYGTGGSLTIAAGQDPGVSSVLGGRLLLNSTLEGYAGKAGASLSLTAPAIQIGGQAANSSTLLLDPTFFSQGGFAGFSLTGLGSAGSSGQPAVLVAPGTVVAPAAQNWVAVPRSDGTGDFDFVPALLPVGLRPPVKLALDAAGVRDPYNSANPLVVRGDLVVGAGGAISTDPGGSIALAGDTVAVLGSVSAPGGAITVAGGKDSSLLFSDSNEALPTVDLGPASRISAAGATVLVPDPRGARTGSVLAGGSIGVSGNIVAEAGSVLDVSGAADTLDLLPSYGGGSSDGSTGGALLVPTAVASAGGAITLAGAQELVSAATLVGRAGGPAAAGGSVTVSSGLFYPIGTNANAQAPTDITLIVSQAGPVLAASLYPAGQTAIGRPVSDSPGGVVKGGGQFGANAFASGGFDSLALNGTVDFAGPVSIQAPGSLTVASGGVIFANGAVNLGASYVDLGAPFQTPLAPLQPTNAFSVQGQPFYFAPAYGPGALTVSGRLIDVGNLSLQGIGQASLIAANGDIRGDGTLDIAGSLSLTAGQIYPPTAVSFTLAAYDYVSGGSAHSGSIAITGSGARQLPSSAAGSLNVYASALTQGGTLVAPFGTINLGSSAGSTPVDAITGKAVNPTQQLTLATGSVTSVSAIDPVTGQALTLPYGLNLNGTSWIDPTGTDITAGGPPAKAVNVSAATITDQAGATIDLAGGGDLYSYRFVPGIGGSEDILASPSSFAVIPGYQAPYAPVGAYNSAPLTTDLGSDPGYVNPLLAVGDQVTLDASPGLPAGTYTLLPARYALLPGAFLVTPQSGAPPAAGSAAQPDGSALVSGYRRVGLDSALAGPPLDSAFGVASSAVLRNRAEYDDSFADTFLNQTGSTGGPGPRLPVDSGQLVLAATHSMTLQGTVLAQAPAGGLGGLVDISSSADILIAGPGATASAGTLVLSAASLSAFGAESLLIGGTRQTGAAGTTVDVATGNLTVSNAGSPLSGTDIILVADDSLTVSPGAQIQQTAAMAGSSMALLLGSAANPGSGDGALLRVSGDAAASITRSGVDASAAPVLAVGAGAKISGAGLILNSTGGMSLDSGALLSGTAVELGSGRITLQLSASAAVPAKSGLVLSGAALQGLESAQSLSLLSYSTIDIYGPGQIGALASGGQPALGSFALHAGEIRAFDLGSGTVTFNAGTILIDDAGGGTGPGPAAPSAGTFSFNAGTIQLGSGATSLDQVSATSLNASTEILALGAGSLASSGYLGLNAPLLTAKAGAAETVSAAGALAVATPAGGPASAPAGGLGASLTLVGSSVTDNGSIALPSGALILRATAGDVNVGNSGAGTINLDGVAVAVFDQSIPTAGGALTLNSDTGSVIVASGASLEVDGGAGGGDAGSVAVAVPSGTFSLAGSMSGRPGAGGQAGSFSLDAGSLPGGSTAALDAALNGSGFTADRSLRIRNGSVTVDGTATAAGYNLSTDRGSITVTGTIDASGAQGGEIGLEAAGSVTLSAGSLLTVAAENFNDAGQGGAVTLEAGAETGGLHSSSALLSIQPGSKIDLSVAAGTAASAGLGDLGGTLHLRAPQNPAGTDLQIGAIGGSIVGASGITAEGSQVFDLTSSGGSITSAVEASVFAGGSAFAANSAAITGRLLAGAGGASGPLASLLSVVPGAEIINTTGDLTLNSAWDLSTFRFGPAAVPGVLTLRAAGNLVFGYTPASGPASATFGSLSDGFDGSSSLGLWNAPLLPAGARSWSYRLVAGADFSAADFHRVLPLASLGSDSGSVVVGANSPPLPLPSNPNSPNSPTSQRQNVIPSFYEVIRTGTGSIDIAAGRDVLLLNPIAAIYTAGTQAPAMANFDTPQLATLVKNTQLGAVQAPIYPAEYSLDGGDVTIAAQGSIAHGIEDGSLSSVTPDSSKELPDNWLYRRGAVDPATGQFATVGPNGEVESTSWWIDFSNFFEGVGALGGGNVSLVAGGNVSNVDAVVPTNARMPIGQPSAASLLELGGGDLTVRAGGDIDGGVYYVERGQGVLSAGGSILTNQTRAALSEAQVVSLEVGNSAPDPSTWLPTTLFLGQGNFNVSSGGDLLLGPVANPFLLPQGVSNNAYEKSYFSTYAATDTVTATSLTGSITLRDSSNDGTGTLAAWVQNVLLYDPSHHQTYASYSQPWLETLETSNLPFLTVESLMPPALRVDALSGSIDVVGGVLLAPSASGNLVLAAAGSINGMQVNSIDTSDGNAIWDSALINVSDADPGRVPGVTTPLSLTGGDAATPSVTPIALMTAIDALFSESGSTSGLYSLIQTKQSLHAPGLLHAGDDNPVELYALGGSISGLTVFSPKQTRVVAGQDITDISLYLQNDGPDDVSLVDAGRDLIAYDPNSPLRVQAQSTGNELLVSGVTTPQPASGNPNAGDIQIGGPGTLEVLAGRNLTMGAGPNGGDGTAIGITSIGNSANPYLPFNGASVIAGAGIGAAVGLDSSRVDFAAFIAQFLNPAEVGGEGGAESEVYLPDLGNLMGLAGESDQQIWSAFGRLTPQQQDSLALDVFYLVLRDAGRNRSVASSPDFGTYDAGFAAIAALFPGNAWSGDISLTSREIKTESGGDIVIFAPGGQLTVGVDLAGNQPVDQGILTADGGNISIFTRDSVNVGTSRIFTLRGGNEILWSSLGNIAAGASSKTVQSAPPTRVLVDPQSADVKTDLAGLATGGGIGVLETVAGVPPGDVDLIAPAGTVDAGQAGIRVSGNLNISALRVVNATNISVGGASVGVPAVVAPSLGGLAGSAGSATAAAGAAAVEAVSRQERPQTLPEDAASLISVEVLGYGGSD